MATLDPQSVQAIFESVSPHLWYMLFQTLAVAGCVLALYKMINAVVSYFYVRFDKELGKNVGVVINNRKGYIAHISIRHLIIKFDEIDGDDVHSGNELLIPITQVSSRTWELIRRKD